MRTWIRRAFLVGLFAAVVVLMNGCAHARAFRPPSSSCSVQQPSPVCDWVGVCGTWLGDLIGCICEAGGGGSGAS
jgi:hypothetical protein